MKSSGQSCNKKSGKLSQQALLLEGCTYSSRAVGQRHFLCPRAPLPPIRSARRLSFSVFTTPAHTRDHSRKIPHAARLHGTPAGNALTRRSNRIAGCACGTEASHSGESGARRDVIVCLFSSFVRAPRNSVLREFVFHRASWSLPSSLLPAGGPNRRLR